MDLADKLLRLIKRFLKDFGWILLLCVVSIYLHVAILEGSYNPIKGIWGGLFFSLYPAYPPFPLNIPIPTAGVLYIVFAVSIRLFKSRFLFFILSWSLVALNNYHAIQKAQTQGLSSGSVRIGGREVYEDGTVTAFGFLVKNFSAETFLALIATGLLLMPYIKEYLPFNKDKNSTNRIA